DARETEVGDLVELTQRRQDGHPHLVGVDLRGAQGPDGLLHPLGEQRQLVLGDRATLAGLAHPDEDLGPAEGLGHAGALHHRQARALQGGEASLARRALAATPDGAAVLGGAAVDDPGVGVPAERAVHWPLPSAVDASVDEGGTTRLRLWRTDLALCTICGRTTSV